MRVLVECITKLRKFAHLILDVAIYTHIAIDIDTTFGLDGYRSIILEDDVVFLCAVKSRFALFYSGAVLAITCHGDNHIAKLQE